jgi:hypothetical protein
MLPVNIVVSAQQRAAHPKPICRPPYTAPVAAAALFSLMMSATTALMIAYARTPFGDPPWTVELQAVLLLGAIVFVWRDISRRNTSTFGGPAWAYVAALATMFIVPAAGILPGAGWIINPLLGVACAAGLASVLRDLREMAIWQWIILLAIAPLAAILYFFVINSYGYANFLSPEFALLGTQHHDTMYHSAIANMIAKFGALTTGLDGLVPIRYHALSHLWFGLVGRWFGFPAINIYYLAVQTVCFPLLFFALAIAVDSTRPTPMAGYNPVLVVLAPLSALSVLEAFDSWASYLVSESYCFALMLFLLGFPILTRYARSTETRWCSPIHIVFGLIAAVLAVAKISVGAIWGAGVLFLAFRKTRMNFLTKTATVAAALVAVIILYFTVVSPNHELISNFKPFHFFQSYPDEAWTLLAAILLFLLAAALLYPRLEVQDRPLIEMLGISAIASAIPALLMETAAGTDYYFINIGTWVAIVFAAGWLMIPSAQRALRASVPVLILLAVTAIAVAATPRKIDAWAATDQLVARLAQDVLKQSAQARGSAAPATNARFNSVSLREIARQMPHTNGGKLRTTVLATGLQPATDVLAYVPPEFEAFWKIQRVCLAQSFVFPAVFALPMINGLPPSNLGCDVGPYYGFVHYGASSHSVAMTGDELCAKALLKGFARILLVKGFQQMELIECFRKR